MKKYGNLIDDLMYLSREIHCGDSAELIRTAAITIEDLSGQNEKLQKACNSRNKLITKLMEPIDDNKK